MQFNFTNLARIRTNENFASPKPSLQTLTHSWMHEHYPRILGRRNIISKCIFLVAFVSLAGFATPSLAQFIGPTAPANWTTTGTGTLIGGSPTAGSTVFSSSQLVLTGSNSLAPAPGGSTPGCQGGIYGILGPCQTQVSIGLGGTYSFTWAYQTFDASGPAGDIFGVIVDGTRIVLSDPGGANAQGGTTSFTATSSFGFFVNSTDGIGGSATVTISGFTYSGSDMDGDGVANDVDCAPSDPTKHTVYFFYRDQDGDSYYGGPLVGVCAAGALTPPTGYSLTSTDCNDADARIYPGATEVCDGVDNNCNGQIDEGFPDTDSDGIASCIDNDDDNDGVPDAYDCAPLDKKNDKWLLCHNGQTLCVAKSALPAHFAHGDYLGSCASPSASQPGQAVAEVALDKPAADNVGVYPNPNKGQFTIQLNNKTLGKAEVQIIDAKGSMVETRQVQLSGKGQTYRVNLANKTNGVYLVRVVSKEGVQVYKVVVQQ